MPASLSPEVERVRYPRVNLVYSAVTARRLAVDCFVTCRLVPARPESGKLSVLGRPDLNKHAAEQPRSAAAITVINACGLGRVGNVESRGLDPCQPEPGDALRQLDADGSSRSLAYRWRTAPLCPHV